MAAPSPLFCDTCGAANLPQALYCRACGHQIQGAKPTIYHSGTGRLLANVVLKQRYRILTPVGKGGMGAVYRAEDMQLGNRPVALKEMSQGGLSPQEAKEAADAFKQEALMLARLQHPNLPSIFDHFEENGRWYLVMSFIEGETLADYLQAAPARKLPFEEVQDIGLQLCTVLDYLHNQQPPIIFRDLKPSNIMRTADGHIYLIDFGIARHFKPAQSKDTAYYASVGYAPPEQYGQAQTTPRSDIYSLGATLYQIVSGHKPATSPFRFPPLQSLVPNVPANFAALITEMLDLDENRRPASIRIVKQRLQATAAPTPPPQSAASPAPTVYAAPIQRATLLQSSAVHATPAGNAAGAAWQAQQSARTRLAPISGLALIISQVLLLVTGVPFLFPSLTPFLLAADLVFLAWSAAQLAAFALWITGLPGLHIKLKSKARLLSSIGIAMLIAMLSIGSLLVIVDRLYFASVILYPTSHISSLLRTMLTPSFWETAFPLVDSISNLLGALGGILLSIAAIQRTTTIPRWPAIPLLIGSLMTMVMTIMTMVMTMDIILRILPPYLFIAPLLPLALAFIVWGIALLRK